MILLIDNYDSFTYNLVQQLPSGSVRVLRNDDSKLEEAAEEADGIILSPGPGRPEAAGLMPKIIAKFYQKKPILGICLGHQAIAQFFGGKVIRANEIKHGKTSSIHHSGKGLFQGMKDFEVMRYHSLIAEETSLPEELVITARACDDQAVMAIQHQTLPIFGLQFHPESIGTKQGQQLINRFLTIMEEVK